MNESISYGLSTQCNHTEEYKGVNTESTRQVNLRCILLSESSQSQKAAYCMVSSLWHPGKGKTIGNRPVVARDWGWGQELQLQQLDTAKGAYEDSGTWLWWLKLRTVHTQKRVNYPVCKLHLNFFKMLMRTISSPRWGTTEGSPEINTWTRWMDWCPVTLQSAWSWWWGWPSQLPSLF